MSGDFTSIRVVDFFIVVYEIFMIDQLEVLIFQLPSPPTTSIIMPRTLMKVFLEFLLSWIGSAGGARRWRDV